MKKRPAMLWLYFVTIAFVLIFSLMNFLRLGTLYLALGSEMSPEGRMLYQVVLLRNGISLFCAGLIFVLGFQVKPANYHRNIALGIIRLVANSLLILFQLWLTTKNQLLQATPQELLLQPLNSLSLNILEVLLILFSKQIKQFYTD